ncbi:MAG: caspase family protein [Pseudomonadota bacterium]
MNLNTALSALIAAFVLMLPLSALAEKRVALVIGNGAYQSTSPLANPVNDAEDMSARLKDLGFTVITGLDQTEADFANRMAEFAEAADRADVALFYYAGHGLQFQESNFLVPVDAKIENQFQVRQETVTLDAIVRLMESRARKVLVFLDACRDNPLANRLKSKDRSIGRGLARVETRAPETLITFAAAPGTVAADGTGRNSPFTASLLKHMGTPGVEIEVMLKRVTADVLSETRRKQRPERLSRLTTEFYFAPADVAEEGGGKSDKEPAPAGGDKLALAAQVWTEVKNTANEDVLKSFIQTFRGTLFEGLAQERLAALVRLNQPVSCAEVLEATKGTPRDGEATLYAGRDKKRPYKVWCAGMASGAPLEYLTLGSTKTNYSTIVHGGAYEGVGGKDMVTRFTRVRFDPERLAILPKDLKFAKTAGKVDQICCAGGGVPQGTRKPMVPAYGVARNCDGRSQKTRTARASVDLARTAFRLAPDMKWKGGGYFPRKTPAARWDISADRRKVAAVPRTGFCAVIGPVGGVIRLEYAGDP